MSHKTNNISILQFNDAQITRLRARRTDKGVDVLGFDIEKGQWSAQDGTLAKALQAFAVKHALEEDHVFTVLPRHEMTARILELPSQDLAEIGSMIRLSVDEFVPFPADELIMDQCLLQKMTDGQAKVLAVFAHKDVVESHLAPLRTAQIDPEQVFLSTACLVSAAMAAKPAKYARYALVNLALGGLEMVVMNGRRFEYGRAVASGQDWAAAPTPGFLDLPTPGQEEGSLANSEVVEELRVEVRATLSAYRRESEDGEGVEGIYFCSDSCDVNPHCQSLQQEMSEECAPADFAKDLVTHGAEHLAGIPLVSLGAALLAENRGEVAIRLLPRSVLSARERTGVKQKALKFAVLGAAVFVALIGLYAQAVYQRNAYIKYLRQRIAVIEPSAKSVLSKQKQLRILESSVDRSGSVIEVLADLCDLYPTADMNVTHFVFTHKEKTELFGRAKSLQLVETLTEDMTKAGKTTIPLLKNAEIIYDNKGQERNTEVRDFAILIPFPKAEGVTRSEDSDIE